MKEDAKSKSVLERAYEAAHSSTERYIRTVSNYGLNSRQAKLAKIEADEYRRILASIGRLLREA